MTKQGAPPSERRERGDYVSEVQGGKAAANITKAHSGTKEREKRARGIFPCDCVRATQIGHKLGTVSEKREEDGRLCFGLIRLPTLPRLRPHRRTSPGYRHTGPPGCHIRHGNRRLFCRRRQAASTAGRISDGRWADYDI